MSNYAVKTLKTHYTVKEAAAELAISPATVRRLCKEAMLEQRYIGTRMVVTGRSIAEFAAALPMLPDPSFWD